MGFSISFASFSTRTHGPRVRIPFFFFFFKHLDMISSVLTLVFWESGPQRCSFFSRSHLRALYEGFFFFLFESLKSFVTHLPVVETMRGGL